MNPPEEPQKEPPYDEKINAKPGYESAVVLDAKINSKPGYETKAVEPGPSIEVAAPGNAIGIRAPDPEPGANILQPLSS